MDPVRSSPSEEWIPEPDASAAVATEDAELAVATAAGDHVRQMKDVPTIPHGLDQPSPAAQEDQESISGPRLRLAGTQAGPLTPQVRMLLELRSELVRARMVQEEEAALIRTRLERNGRPDPISVVTGADAFARSDEALSKALAEIDNRLEHLDGRAVVRVEIEAGVERLLDRR